MQINLEVVLLNYRRPANISAIAAALHEQTVVPKLTLIDQAGQGEFRVPATTRAAFDRVIEISHNHGCFARYGIVPLLDARYTLFLDDDMLPGSHSIEYFLNQAEALSKQYSVLGQIGRLLPEALRYQPTDVPRLNEPRPVDFVIRGSCYLTDYLTAVDPFRRVLGIVAREDDIVAQAAVQLATHLPAGLLAQHPDPTTRMNWRELPTPFANGEQAIHTASRNTAVATVMRHGYVPFRLRP